MAEKLNLAQRWDRVQPTKGTVFWGVVVGAAATMIIGFSWGGWVTAGSARTMAEKAAQAAHQELAAAVCTDHFAAAPDARAQLTAFKSISSSYQRDKFVEDGGWAVMPGASNADRQDASACADGLFKLKLPPLAEAAQTAPQPTVAQ
jgi:alpha/beta superfamily hydrolase